MDEHDILERIRSLVDEEHRLQADNPGNPPSEEEQARLRQLEVQLDQCWDLLRQRRARRDAGLDPDGAHVREAGIVEGYQQ